MISLQNITSRYWEGAFLVSLVGLVLKQNTRVMFDCHRDADKGGYRLTLTLELDDVWGNVDFADGETSCFTPAQMEELIGPVSVSDVVHVGLARAESEISDLLAVLTLRKTNCTVSARHTDQGNEFELLLGDKVLRAVDPAGKETKYHFRKPRKPRK